jgi:VWFA-related protein
MMSTSFARSLSLLAAAALAVGAVIAADQTTPPSSQARPPQFRSGIDLVQVDVSVLDRDRRPVRGLTAQNFTILENGKPQGVAAFQAVDMPDELPPPTPWMRDVIPDVRRNDEAIEHRLVVIVMDDASMIAQPAFVRSAKEIAHRVIDALGPSDLSAVLFTLDNRKSQEFTPDRARLHEAVERFAAGFRTVGMAPGMAEATNTMALAESNAFYAAVGTLEKAAEYLASVPQRRKALIYVSVGVPVDTELSATPQLIGGGIGGQSLQGMLANVTQRMQRVFRQAQLANVNIYPVDPAGLGGMEAYIESQRAAGRVMFPYENSRNYLDFLQTLAANTGGRAFTNTNEFASSVAQIFRENASYYLLGYRSPDANPDGKFRRIEVRVDRPGLEVRARNGYYAAKAEDLERAVRRPPSPIAEAISGLLPKGEVPMQLAVAPFRLPSRSESGVAIVTAVRQPANTEAVAVVEKVDLAVYAYNNDGKLIASQALRADVRVRAGTNGQIGYELLSQLTLKPGRYQLRFGAHIPSLKTNGSVYYDLEVPDFADLPLSLSGVVLSVSPSLMVAPRDRLKNLLPVVPTAQRDFRSTNRVTAFLQVYQGGRDRPDYVDLDVNILDSQGTAVFHSLHEIAPDRFGPRGAEYQLDLPMTRLTPGPYLLSIEASSQRETARRDIRFVVVR